MRVSVSVDDFFCAAHRFDGLPSTMPESRLHGHTWKVRATWTGELTGIGVVQEASMLKAILSELVKPLRHTLLNDIEDLEFVTGEGIAIWLFKRLAVTNAGSAQFSMVEVWREPEGIRAVVSAS
jgi:6-pyruvoyltetrahydropterin/6-carboxytetrahydropterin synthase